MKHEEALLRRLIEAHNSGGDEEISLVYWWRGGRVTRIRAFRSHDEAMAAAGA